MSCVIQRPILRPALLYSAATLICAVHVSCSPAVGGHWIFNCMHKLVLLTPTLKSDDADVHVGTQGIRMYVVTQGPRMWASVVLLMLLLLLPLL